MPLAIARICRDPVGAILSVQRHRVSVNDRIVRPAQSVLNEIGPERKVNPLNKILKAFEISRIDFNILNYQVFQEKIPDAQKQIRKLEPELDKLLMELEAEDGFKADPEFSF
ncbi:MAG: hypothetical protein ABIS36_25900 [Chryseolinea sp.]